MHMCILISFLIFIVGILWNQSNIGVGRFRILGGGGGGWGGGGGEGKI